MESRIYLNKITRLHFGCNDSKRLTKIKKKIAGREHLALAVVAEGKKQLDLVFNTPEQMITFVTGLQIYINSSHSQAEDGNIL